MRVNQERKNKNIKIYNILFPVWLFYLWPTPLWLLIIPLNAVIDGLVLNFALRFYKIKLNIWDKSLLKVCNWLFKRFYRRGIGFRDLLRAWKSD